MSSDAALDLFRDISFFALRLGLSMLEERPRRCRRSRAFSAVNVLVIK